MMLCFRLANALATWRQAQVCLRPLLITAKQSLPAASTPAPGPHTSRSHRCYATLSSVGLIQIALGAFSDTGG